MHTTHVGTETPLSLTQAGPNRCALASKNATATNIAKNIDDLIERLYDRPLAAHKANRPGVLTASMVKSVCVTSSCVCSSDIVHGI